MAKPDEALDLAIALSLEEEFKRETKEERRENYELPKESSGAKYNVMLNPRNVVDQHWELTDPNPNIHELFIQFDCMFFWSMLSNRGVAVRWSKRMTLCAGTCSYEGRGGLCSIQLSEPLMRLRPRKDLVETLLHEMIHAYLFVTDNNTDHDGHGPNFLHHMKRINGATGANISVYHTFHDEVREYRKHWWKCNGPCQHRPPYYGVVMRAMNRAPSPSDRWWADHQRTCGGSYEKIKEPEGYKKRGSNSKEEDKKSVKSRNIKDMFAGAKNKAKEEKQDNGSTSVVTPFGGQGHSLESSSKDRSFVEPVRTKSERDIREKILTAAEKRRTENEQRGVKVAGKKRLRINSPSPLSNGWCSSSDHSSATKRSKFDRSPNDVIVLDTPPPLPQVQPPNFEDHHVKPLSTDTSPVLIDLSSDKEECSNKNTTVRSESSESDDVIATDDDVITLNDSNEGGSHSLSDLTEFKTCPVCGMANIPAVIINTHVAFCLDAEEESRTVDNDDLL